MKRLPGTGEGVIYENAEKFKIDKNRIALGGDSAGGALATAVAQMARDRKGPEVIFQMLIYPVTDSRQKTESIKKFVDTPLLNSKVNKGMWKLYLKDSVKGNKAYAAPNEAEGFSDLPSAYIEVAEFDCLRDEGLEYAKSLEEAGVEVKVREVKGAIHDFEIAKNSDYIKEVIKSRGETLKEAFERQRAYRLDIKI